jgi:hypothetical protein
VRILRAAVHVALVGSALAFSFASAGCGRRATEADCDIIVDHMTELQMKAMHITDPVAIDKRKKEIHDELKAQLQGCVGRRVSDAMMACVARSQTADEFDKCLR